MAKRIGFMFLENQLTLVLHGRPTDIDSGHPRYKEIVALLQRPADETEEEEGLRAEKLQSLLSSDRLDLREAAAAVGVDDVVIDHGVVVVKGKALRNSLTKRILELKAAGLPYTGFIRFLVNLLQNPSEASRSALYDFLEQGRFPLTDDGYFLGYKGVRKGELTRADGSIYTTLVDCHSGRFDMSPGQKHSMPWAAVDNNRNQACGAGFHIGTIHHARGYGDTMIVVKVNPKDCVSVPLEEKHKLRACAYEVVNIYSEKESARELIKPVYTQEEITFEDFQKVEEEEYKLREPTEAERRAKFEAMGRDDICRAAAIGGIFASTNEARWLGKEIVVAALMANAIPFDVMTRDTTAELAVRRHLFSSVSAALKVGLPKIQSALRADNAARQAEMKAANEPAEDE